MSNVIMSEALKTFLCYAREDRDAVDDLRKYLKQLERKKVLEIWDDGEILPGQDWDLTIKKKLEIAQLILLFITIDFINSDYITSTELQAALQRHRENKAVLIPIIVKRCEWEDHFGMGQFQALPKDAKSIKSVDINVREEVYFEISQSIKEVAFDLKDKIEKEINIKKREKELQDEISINTNKDRAAWEAAQEVNSIEAYELYLEKYNLFASEAHERIAKIVIKKEAQLRSSQINIGRYLFDYKNLQLSTEGFSKSLTKREADLLKLLYENVDQVINRNTILRQLWGEETYKNGRSLDVFITRLRSYLAHDEGIAIDNLHGVGFRLKVNK